MYDQKKCSPISKKTIKNNTSCLNKDLLLKLQKILDVKHSNNIKILYKNISSEINKMSNCTTEVCWITIDKIINKLSKKDIGIFKNLFKPMMPKIWDNNKYEWLNTLDIENVLNQYSNAHKDFYFYGAIPNDYDNKTVCNIYDLCNINIKKHIKDGIKKIGIVFNTDDSSKGGKHWICMYIDLIGNNYNSPGIYYFDSLGKKPQDNIKKLINNIRSQKKLIYFYNDVKHQMKNSECGIYCIHFIIYMLNNGSFEKYISTKKSDKYIHKYRYFYFNKI